MLGIRWPLLRITFAIKVSSFLTNCREKYLFTARNVLGLLDALTYVEAERSFAC